MTNIHPMIIFSLPELAQGELLGYLNVRHPSSVNNFLGITLAATVLIKYFSNLLRMFVLMISGLSLNTVGMGSKYRSLGQISEKSC